MSIARTAATLLLAAGALLALQQDSRAGAIFPNDIDQWKAEVVVGKPGSYAFIQGPAREGGLAGTGHIAFDRAGNMYMACGTFIQVVGRDGVAHVLAGTPGVSGATDGPAAKATFGGAVDLAIGKDDVLYVVDAINLTVRRLEKKADGWQVSTAAGVAGKSGHRDGATDQALFENPFDGIAISDAGVVYVMDANWLRKIENGTVTTLNAGTGSANGPLAQAGFNRAMGGCPCLSFGNEDDLYVADRWNQAIRKVDLKKGEVTTYAGCEPGAKWGPPADGPALQARFHAGGGPCQVLFVRKQNFLLAKAADEDCPRIVRDGMMMTFGFTGGEDIRKPAEGPIRSLIGGYAAPVGEDAEGNIYIGNDHRVGSMIRKVTKTKEQP